MLLIRRDLGDDNLARSQRCCVVLGLTLPEAVAAAKQN